MRSTAANSLVCRLKTRQLLLLTKLEETRSVRRAAEACHMTQPAATKLLQEMEQAVDAKLFERHARGVKPTWYGEIMVQHARNALMELAQAYDEMAAFKAGLRGHVRIGTEGTSATNLVPEAIAALKRDHPEVVVRVDMDFSEMLVRRLQEGELDIAIARLHNARELSELRYEPIEEAKHVIACRPGHPLLTNAPASWQSFLSQTWVLPPQGNVLRDKLTLLLLEENLPLPKRIVETSYLPIIVNLLKTSDMISPLAQETVQFYSSLGVLSMLEIPLPLRLGRSGIITRRDDRLFPGAKAMLEALRHAARGRTGGGIEPPHPIRARAVPPPNQKRSARRGGAKAPTPPRYALASTTSTQ